MKIRYENKSQKPVPVREIKNGTVFSGMIMHDTPGVFILLHGLIVDLRHLDNMWNDLDYSKLAVYHYKELDVELVIKGEL